MRELDQASLIEIMPPSLTSDKNALAMADAVDPILWAIAREIASESIYPQLSTIDNSDLIDLLAWQLHVEFYDQNASIETRKRQVATSIEWHMTKGTPAAVEMAISTVYPNAKISEWFEYGGAPYFFRLRANGRLADEEKLRELLYAVNATKNARSWLESITINTDTTTPVCIATAAATYSRAAGRVAVQ